METYSLILVSLLLIVGQGMSTADDASLGHHKLLEAHLVSILVAEGHFLIAAQMLLLAQAFLGWTTTLWEDNLILR